MSVETIPEQLNKPRLERQLDVLIRAILAHTDGPITPGESATGSAQRKGGRPSRVHDILARTEDTELELDGGCARQADCRDLPDYLLNANPLYDGDWEDGRPRTEKHVTAAVPSVEEPKGDDFKQPDARKENASRAQRVDAKGTPKSDEETRRRSLDHLVAVHGNTGPQRISRRS